MGRLILKSTTFLSSKYEQLTGITGSMDESGGTNGNLYKIQRGAETLMETGISISNGIAWSSDNLLMYYIDTPTRRVDVFDFNGVAGTIGKILVDFFTHKEPSIDITFILGSESKNCVRLQHGW